MKKILLLFFLVLSFSLTVKAQSLSHEIGVFAGSSKVYSDYLGGGNGGFGGGLVYYVSTTSKSRHWSDRAGSGSEWINNHMRARLEISYFKSTFTNINSTTGSSYQAVLLNGLTGSTKMTNFGGQLEFNFTRFDAEKKLNPYISVGYFLSLIDPDMQSVYGSIEDNPNLVPTVYREGGLFLDKRKEGSFSFGAGTRYRFTDKLSLMLDFRWQRFSSDKVDGLVPLVSANKYRDWVFFFGSGLVFTVY